MKQGWTLAYNERRSHSGTMWESRFRVRDYASDELIALSSVGRLMGLHAPVGATGVRDARAERAAYLVTDIRRDWAERLSEDLICRWHRDLLAPDPSAGRFRKHQDALKVVRRNAYGEWEVRFEASPSARVGEEMRRFVVSANDFHLMDDAPANIVLKAVLFHPYFESIHPFEDGNGRIGRALVVKFLAEAIGDAVLVPVSPRIGKSHQAYYEELHRASLTLDWTRWALFFLPLLLEAMNDYCESVRFVLGKRDYLARVEARIDPRPLSVLKRMLKDGADGVARGLSAAKYQRMTGVSKATATRDLSDLTRKGALEREGGGRGARYHLTFKWPSLAEYLLEGTDNAPLLMPTGSICFGEARVQST